APPSPDPLRRVPAPPPRRRRAPPPPPPIARSRRPSRRTRRPRRPPCAPPAPRGRREAAAPDRTRGTSPAPRRSPRARRPSRARRSARGSASPRLDSGRDSPCAPGSAADRRLLQSGSERGLATIRRGGSLISLLLAISLYHVPANLGYAVLFGLILVESAGAPVPGETSLIAAGVLASAGNLSLPVVFVVAISAAIIGDNLGYLFGLKVGHRVLLAPGRWERQRRQFVEEGEHFFARHGGKTVFFGRWLPVLRFTAALLAGVN